MKRYMRDQYEFFGVKTPERRGILKSFLLENGLPHDDAFNEAIVELWEMPERELQIVAINLIDLKIKKKELSTAFLPVIEQLITTKSWWDTVDHIATKHVGILFQNEPALIENVGRSWRNSDDIWLRRTMILFQQKYKTNTNQELLADIITENLGSSEFFINKAIGWSLREYAKTNPIWVKEFVAQTTLSNLSKREALKHIK
ncbi:DNA alkylation repair protein [Bacillus sp. HMF5848]|nr:DNA alkylation repair protein [Bacillus sp. HMF5848]